MKMILILVKEKLALVQDDASRSYSGHIVGQLFYVTLDFWRVSFLKNLGCVAKNNREIISTYFTYIYIFKIL